MAKIYPLRRHGAKGEFLSRMPHMLRGDDPLTAKEKAARDAFFKKIGVTRVFSFPHAANCMTFLGIALAGFALYDYWRTASLMRQVVILGLAWITDILDGPIARNNNAVTALGTALDHGRDYAIFSWMIALAVLNARHIPPSLHMIYALYAVSVAALLAVFCRHLLAYAAFRKNAFGNESREKRVLAQFLRQRVRTTVTARCCMVLFVVGSSLFLVGIETGLPALAVAGVTSTCLHLLALGAYLFESFLEPHQRLLFYQQLLRRGKKVKVRRRNKRKKRGEPDSSDSA